MRIVLDTNVLISALIKDGKAREVLRTIANKKVQLVLSADMLEELLEVADDPRIRRYVSEEDVMDFLRVLGSIARIATVRSRFKVVSEGPDDDVILHAAHDGEAQYVVSGDGHLLLMTHENAVITMYTAPPHSGRPRRGSSG